MTTKPVAVITGAAQGIGLACAKALASNGYRPVLGDVNEQAVQDAARMLGEGALAYTCDVGDADQVIAMFDQLEAEASVASVLVNCAGIASVRDFLDVTPAEFRRVIDINLTGTFVATQRAARAMVADGIAGSIINISSINAVVAIASVASYCTSKGGVTQLTKASALALAPHNIRVNAVGPGSIDTAMLASIHDDPSAMKRVLSRTPLGRIGAADEIAEVVAFLASDKASYITGETIYADGGRLALNYTC